jgi:serine/threonine protein kinase
MQTQQISGLIAERYHILRPLAQGGMSVIYLARDNQTEKNVAIKLVHRSASEYCERFQREVQVLARFKHQHILPALAYGEHECWHYLIMPYIEYGTLSKLLGNGPLPPTQAGTILEQLASALHYAHEHDVVHRDIKPSNILLEEGKHVYLTDFGLVKVVGGSHSLTRSGYLIGTPEYMAPELVDQPATIASEVYALGVLLYQMLCGRVPFKGSTPVVTVWKHIQDTPEPLTDINPALPASLEPVVLKALAKDPAERFQSVMELAQVYQAALANEVTGEIEEIISEEVAVRVVPISALPLATRTFTRPPIKLLLLLVALLLLGSLMIFSLSGLGSR